MKIDKEKLRNLIRVIGNVAGVLLSAPLKLPAKAGKLLRYVIIGAGIVEAVEKGTSDESPSEKVAVEKGTSDGSSPEEVVVQDEKME